MLVGSKVVILRNHNPNLIGETGTISEILTDVCQVCVNGCYEYISIKDLEILPTLAQIVRNNTCDITFYRSGNIYYEVQVDKAVYTFPVSL